MPVLTKVYFIPPVGFVPGLCEKKNWWSNQVPRTMSLIFNQFASGLLHSVLHLRMYDIKQAYDFVCYMYNFKPEKGR